MILLMKVQHEQVRNLALCAHLGSLAAAVGSAVATTANAAAIDVSDVTTDIAASQPIGLIGGAVLLIVVAVAAFRWVRSALR